MLESDLIGVGGEFRGVLVDVLGECGGEEDNLDGARQQAGGA